MASSLTFYLDGTTRAARANNVVFEKNEMNGEFNQEGLQKHYGNSLSEGCKEREVMACFVNGPLSERTVEPARVVGFTKCNMKLNCCNVCGSNTGCSCPDKKGSGRRPALICKPLQNVFKTGKKKNKFNAGCMNDLRGSGTDTALRISSSISSICRRYDCSYANNNQSDSGDLCCNYCPPACCPQCSCSSDSTDSLYQPACCQPACCQPVSCCPAMCAPPPAPPCWGGCCTDKPCPVPCSPPVSCPSPSPCQDPVACISRPNPGKHCPWPKRASFVPLPFDPKPACLPLPAVIPKPSYNCPCTCNCEDTDSEVDVSCQNSIDDESPLAGFFQNKMSDLTNRMREQCQQVDDKTKELEQSMRNKMDEEGKLCDTEKRVLETCRSVKKVECELMNIKNKICNVSLKCMSEKEETFCPKVAIQYVRVLQSKLEKVRSGSMLKDCLLKMCKESKVRLTKYNQELRTDIEKVQAIAKKIKTDIEEIKKAICQAASDEAKRR